MRPPRSKLPAAWIVALLLLGFLGALKIGPGFSKSGRAGMPDTEASAEPGAKQESIGRMSRIEAAAPAPLSEEDRKGAGTAEGQGKLAARMSRRTDGLEIVTHADGRQSIHLKGRFAHASAVVTGPDGRTEVRCFSSFDDLGNAMSPNPVPAAPTASPPSAEF